ncbi:hypothetical protein CETAM_03180 [Corynebacterium comes]|uniref:DNA-directed RNA polymerase II n=1 Tax=Corynebacterium comes TaxID=2675218 RepID=A0A6B8VZ00_9CORY|nr:hypothetical protein CETAM_03180 [Corynebacterium comes]
MSREGTKNEVKAENRRVYLFIVVGLVAAAVIGYGVWRAGTPSTPSASDTATTTTEVSTISESARRTGALPAPGNPADSPEHDTQPSSSPVLDDPYLAPHAVVQTSPTGLRPTVVYRPENIMPTTISGEPTELISAQGAEPAGTSPTTDVPTTDVPASAVVSATPPTPDAEVTPPQSTQTPTPAEPTEPTIPTTAASEPTAPTAPAGTTQQAVPTVTAEAAPPAEAEQPAVREETATVTAPEVEQAAVPPQRPGWWPLGAWFPFGS